jgi:hypothetical protein
MQIYSSTEPKLWTPASTKTCIENGYCAVNSHNPLLGKCEALFLPICEIFLELIEKPLTAVESAGRAGINFLGSLFDSECSVRNALFYAEKAVSNLIHTPLSILPTPAQYVQQAVATFFDPKAVLPANKIPTLQTDSYTKQFKQFVAKMQDALYGEEKDPTLNPIAARLISPFLSFTDVFLDTLAPMIAAIEKLARAVIQLACALFHKDCSIKGAIYCTKDSLKEIANIGGALALFPFKFLYQTCAIIYDPVETLSIRNFTEVENEESDIDDPILPLDPLEQILEDGVQNYDFSKLSSDDLLKILSRMDDDTIDQISYEKYKEMFPQTDLTEKKLTNLSPHLLNKILEKLPVYALQLIPEKQIQEITCFSKISPCNLSSMFSYNKKEKEEKDKQASRFAAISLRALPSVVTKLQDSYVTSTLQLMSNEQIAKFNWISISGYSMDSFLEGLFHYDPSIEKSKEEAATRFAFIPAANLKPILRHLTFKTKQLISQEQYKDLQQLSLTEGEQKALEKVSANFSSKED